MEVHIIRLRWRLITLRSRLAHGSLTVLLVYPKGTSSVATDSWFEFTCPLIAVSLFFCYAARWFFSYPLHPIKAIELRTYVCYYVINLYDHTILCFQYFICWRQFFCLFFWKIWYNMNRKEKLKQLLRLGDFKKTS